MHITVLVAAPSRPLASIYPESGMFWWKLLPKHPPHISSNPAASQSLPDDDPCPSPREAQDHSHRVFKLVPRKQTHGFKVSLPYLLFGVEGWKKITQKCFIH